MPSRLQTAYRALKNRMGDKGASDSKESVTPLDSAWSKVLTILSVMNNAHVSVDGNPPVMKLVDGLRQPNKETVTFGSRKAIVNEKPVTLCYFSHRIDDVTYYVTARGNGVALQSFPDEPDVNTSDGRLFEMSMNKTWAQFKSFGTDLYLSHDTTGLHLQAQRGADRNPFNFDLIEKGHP